MPRRPKTPNTTGTDAVQIVKDLGGLISHDMATCVLCGPNCRCADIEFGSPEYVAHVNRAHGPVPMSTRAAPSAGPHHEMVIVRFERAAVALMIRDAVVIAAPHPVRWAVGWSRLSVLRTLRRHPGIDVRWVTPPPSATPRHVGTCDIPF